MMIAMDLKLLATTFATVFLAELGDKTQLATLAFSASGSSRWSIFLGSAGALVASSAIAVLAGVQVARLVNPALLKAVAGIGFIAIGLWVLYRLRAES